MTASLRTSGGARTVLLRMAADQERADRIRTLKQARPDLTWRRIADFVGVTERSATDWQSKGGIDYANAEKLAELFKVDVDFIWRGPTENERSPSPFAGQDALAARLDEIQGALENARLEREQHAAQIERLLSEQDARLKRQDTVLDRIERAVEDERKIRDEAQAATQALLAAVDVANRVLLGGTRPLAEAPEQPAT